MEIEQKIIKAIEEAGQPLKPGEISAKAGLTKEETDKAIGKLKKENIIYSPKRCFYDIQK